MSLTEGGSRSLSLPPTGAKYTVRSVHHLVVPFLMSSVSFPPFPCINELYMYRTSCTCTAVSVPWRALQVHSRCLPPTCKKLYRSSCTCTAVCVSERSLRVPLSHSLCLPTTGTVMTYELYMYCTMSSVNTLRVPLRDHASGARSGTPACRSLHLHLAGCTSIMYELYMYCSRSVV